MKRFRLIITAFIIIFMSPLSALGQDNKEVKITLKNRKVVIGKCVALKVGEWVDVMTRDSVQHHYTWDEMELIKHHHSYRWNAFTTEFDSEKGVPRGYRGFIDVEYTPFFDGLWQLSTSQGYQIFPCLYVGAGFTFLHPMTDNDKTFPKKRYNTCAVFGDVRIDCIKANTTPFFDLRVGKQFSGHTDGLYLSAMLGVRAGLRNRHLGVNVALGITRCTISTFENEGLNKNRGFAPEIRVGFEF